MQNKIEYYNEVTNIILGQVEANCNSICFYNPTVNVGTLFVNDLPVPPSTIFSLDGKSGEIDTTIYNTRATSNEAFFVIRKYYK
jgi:hypothetical protein